MSVVARHHHVMGVVQRLDHVHRRHQRGLFRLGGVALLGEVPGQIGEDVGEHRIDVVEMAVAERAQLLQFLLGGADLLAELGLQRRVALLVPFAEPDQMLLQPRDRIAERPGLAGVLGPVGGRIVRGRMALGAIGEELDQGRAQIGARPVGRPAGRGIDGERVIAVHPEAGNAIADRARREGGEIAAGDAAEAGDRPLVVDDVEDHRRAIDAGEGDGVVEIALGGRAVADPAGGDPAVALDRARHRPADRLRILGAEIAGDREEALLPVRIHDRQLAAFQLVALVRVDLVHHLDERIIARDQQALLAIGREAHVLRVHRMRGRDRHRLLAQRLHVEAGLALALGAEHPLVEDPDHQHVAQDAAQLVGVELRIPRADRLAVVVEDADESVAERMRLGGGDGDIRARRSAGGRHGDRR